MEAGEKHPLRPNDATAKRFTRQEIDEARRVSRVELVTRLKILTRPNQKARLIRGHRTGIIIKRIAPGMRDLPGALHCRRRSRDVQ